MCGLFNLLYIENSALQGFTKAILQIFIIAVYYCVPTMYIFDTVLLLSILCLANL